ncbi:hypothetical protein [Candidatus Cryosericum terrychapinii]|uniref:Uncharacterized protein n=1 Tax=Candidatus Cryosericum terrychapinii TaxID=2290919 RepID=A0A398D6S8_9BACT|nr:hypothetical protein [Candidatus Cryosericum terrychapinii]RIE06804.1 hypothetical protein SMC7_00720 [Candidatus Cryosericum terrychapinii]
MARKQSNQEYADVVLQTLYAKDIGARARGIDDLVRLANSRLDGADKQTLLNIVGSKAGLFGQGLVDCRPAEGDGAIFGILDIELTDAGRAHVREQQLPSPRKVLPRWLAAGLIFLAGAVATAVVEWLVRRLLGS